jgi:regulator of replication initiation timing
MQHENKLSSTNSINIDDYNSLLTSFNALKEVNEKLMRENHEMTMELEAFRVKGHHILKLQAMIGDMYK